LLVRFTASLAEYQSVEVLPVGVAFGHPGDDAGCRGLFGGDPREVPEILLGFSDDLRIVVVLGFRGRRRPRRGRARLLGRERARIVIGWFAGGAAVGGRAQLRCCHSTFRNWNAGLNDGGDAEHFNGSTWTATKLPVPTAQPGLDMTSISGSSPSDIWAAGTAFNEDLHRNNSPVLEHFNGTSWSNVTVPVSSPTGGLTDVLAITPH
jgi:hypothetical protein